MLLPATFPELPDFATPSKNLKTIIFLTSSDKLVDINSLIYPFRGRSKTSDIRYLLVFELGCELDAFKFNGFAGY